MDLEEKGLNPDNLNVVIKYGVEYKSTVNAKYMSNVIIPDGVTATMNITDGSGNTVTPGKYYEMTPSGTEEKIELNVHIVISKIDMGVSGKFVFTNYITQKNNSNAIDGEGDVSDGSAFVGETSGVYVQANNLPTDANKFGVTVTTDDSNNKATLDLSLVDSSGNKITTFASNVNVTTVLDGKYDTLYFNGTGEQPTYTYVYDTTNDKTTITFTTSHFSKFVACADTVAVSTSSDFINALDGEKATIALLDDITTSDEKTLNGSNKAVDLNGNTLTFKNIKLQNGSSLKFMDGKLVGTSNINVWENSTVALDGVEYMSGGHALKAWGPNATINVKDSSVTGKYIAIMSDASTESGVAKYGGVAINIENSFISANDSSGDTTAVIINVDGTLKISDSTLKAGRQCLIVRAGDAQVEDTEFIYLNDYNGSDTTTGHTDGQYESSWANGNRVSRAAVVVGNITMRAYASDAVLSLENCKYTYSGSTDSESTGTIVNTGLNLTPMNSTFTDTDTVRALVIAQDSANGKSAKVSLDSDCKATFSDSIYSMTTGGTYVKESFTDETFVKILPAE